MHLHDRPSITSAFSSSHYRGILSPFISNEKSKVIYSIYSIKFCGLIAHYAANGFVYGSLFHSIIPLLTFYLNMEGADTVSAVALISLPHTIRIFVYILSNSVPILGCHRRPYIVLGWTICCMCLCYIGTKPMPSPYYPNAHLKEMKPMEYSNENWKNIHRDSATAGGQYIKFLTLAVLGIVIAECSTDTIVLEYAHSDSTDLQGYAMLYSIRSLFVLLAHVFIGTTLNSRPFGGTFNFGLPFSFVAIILAGIAALAVPMSWICIQEEKRTRQSIATSIRSVWDVVQQAAYYQMIAYSFCTSVCLNVSYVAYYPITNYWVKTSAFNMNMSNITANFLFAVTILVSGKFALVWNWRCCVSICTILGLLMNAICAFLITFDIVRSQYIWLGIPVLENVTTAIAFVVSTFVIIELSDKGCEGIGCCILTFATNLGNPISAIVTRYIDMFITIRNMDVQNDAESTRKSVAYSILIAYGCRLCALLFLFCLPKNRKKLAKLKAREEKSRFMGALTIGYLLCALVWCIVANVWTMYGDE